MKRITATLVLVAVASLTSEVLANPDCKDDTGPPFFDPSVTSPTDPSCHDFGAEPIPADFFGPGSDPFDGEVCFEGVPLGPTAWGEFGDADTLVQRSADPFDRCALPSDTEVTVSIEIVALSLVSSDPITVTFNGGQNPEQWDVAVALSPTVTPSPGELNATKTHCNGGTYSSVFHIQPKYTFTRVGGGGGPLELDTGQEGMTALDVTENSIPWISDPDGPLAPTNPVCTDFHPAVEDASPVTDCDCNANDLRDKCDIEGESDDNNFNGVPDECEAVPAASEWGLVVFALLTVTFGTVMVGRRSRGLTAAA